MQARRGRDVVIGAFRNRNSIWMLPALLLAAMVGRTAEAKSTVNLCNAGNTAISLVTIGDEPGGGWVIDGWQTIAVGECRSHDLTFHIKIGVAIVKAGSRRGMQLYDPTVIAHFGPNTVLESDVYCVDPNQDFHRRGHTLQELKICKPGEARARIAFIVKLWPGETVTIRIPADANGEIVPFDHAASDIHSFPPFKPNDRPPPPNASFALAMKGLAEQQERLDFRIAQREPEPNAAWSAYYLRDLGIVVRPETHAVSVAKGSPADVAGIRRGDEIVAIGEIMLQSAWHARSLLVRSRPGDVRAVTFLQNGVLRTEKIALAALPANLAATELHPKQGWLGLEFESAARVVAAIWPDGAPHLEPGDDIMKIGRSDFDGVDGLARWLSRDLDAATVELEVRRAATGKINVMMLDKLK